MFPLCILLHIVYYIFCDIQLVPGVKIPSTEIHVCLRPVVLLDQIHKLVV